VSWRFTTLKRLQIAAFPQNNTASAARDPFRLAGSWLNPAERTTKKPLKSRGIYASGKLSLDLHEDTGRHDQTIQRFDGSSGRLKDIDNALVRPHLKLLTRLLVNMRATEDRVTLDPGRNRNRSAHTGVGTLGVINDFSRRGVKCPVVVRFHPNSNSIASHLKLMPLAAPTTTDNQSAAAGRRKLVNLRQ
jgi:hypothetical protein